MIAPSDCDCDGKGDDGEGDEGEGEGDNDDGTDQPLDVSKELLRVYVSGSNANLFRISSSVVVLVSEYRS